MLRVARENPSGSWLLLGSARHHAAAVLLIAAGDNPNDCTARPPSPSCAVSVRSRRPRARPSAVDSIAVGPASKLRLYSIVLPRLRWDNRSRHYIQRRIAEGKTAREAIRWL
ncbi:MAG TPA: hypothetical protein VN748_16115 [Pseudonocardiaceae bacterium]|nr:hypothetical protein [Pseudonocardiaceae bacterium]